MNIQFFTRSLLSFLILIYAGTIRGQEEPIPTFGERFEKEENAIASFNHRTTEEWQSDSPASGYSDYGWKKLDSAKFADPPKLEEGESISNFHGVAYADGLVIWVVSVKKANKSMHLLLSWNSQTGDTKRSDTLSDKVQGLAWDKLSRVLLVRTNSNLLRYEPKDLILLSNSPFLKVKNEWKDMLVAGNEIIIIGQDNASLDFYDKLTLQQMRTIRTESTKLQRIFLWNEDTILLWSSFLGAKVKAISFNTNQTEETFKLSFPFRSMFKASMIDREKLGVFDFYETKVSGVIIKNGRTFLNLGKHVEVDKSGLGIRYSPDYQTITAYATLQPKQSITAGKVVFSLPFQSNYAQEILEESIDGEIIQDKYGNRFGVVKVSNLQSGTPYEIEIYKAKVARFRSSFDFSKSNLDQSYHPSFQRYFKDHPIYQLSDPTVTNVFGQVIAPNDDVLTKISKIYAFTKTIKGVWDGKNEPVPNVLKNMHGGCNEHTRVQVAFLQLANIPGRYAWNHIYREKDDKDFTVDHAIAEAWVSGIGWIPLEGLGGNAGALSPYLFYNVGFPFSGSIKPEVEVQVFLNKNNGSVVWKARDL